MTKPLLRFSQLWNMSFGFVGIQFGFGLQQANMSAIYAKLGAEPSRIPLLWLAGPLTGLLVQPIIGAMSDHTWNWLGRRRPYFLFGAIFSSVALFFMPDATSVWMAATILWVLDTATNVSMEPFRAFVVDKLNPSQRTVGFVVQGFFIGIGAAIANAMPAILGACGVHGTAANGIPFTVQISFRLGALAFFLAVLWTVLTTREDPPENMEEFLARKKHHKAVHLDPLFIGGGALAGAALGILRGFVVDHQMSLLEMLAGAAIGGAIGTVLGGPEVSSAIREMPRTMQRLALVQFVTWMGLFCMWMFFTLATAQQIYHSLDPKTEAFDQGTAFGGQTFAWYSIVCFIVAFALPPLSRLLSRRLVHALALLFGGASLLATGFLHDRLLWQLNMLGVGIAWASILVMPYAILSDALPAARRGVYMGIFNFFIVIPEILASLSLEPIMRAYFAHDPVKVVMLGGFFLLIAALLMRIVPDNNPAAESVEAIPQVDETGPTRAQNPSP